MKDSNRRDEIPTFLGRMAALYEMYLNAEILALDELGILSHLFEGTDLDNRLVDVGGATNELPGLDLEYVVPEDDDEETGLVKGLVDPLEDTTDNDIVSDILSGVGRETHDDDVH